MKQSLDLKNISRELDAVGVWESQFAGFRVQLLEDLIFMGFTYGFALFVATSSTNLEQTN